MPTFALIAEGMTDVAVIERIVEGMFGDSAVVNALMPLRDATDSARAQANTFSTWELVFEYIASPDMNLALATNDYLIVHIDTDQGEHANFGLPLSQGGKIRKISEIVSNCKTLLLGKLPADFPEELKLRIIFAVPVLSTECWLLPIYDEKHQHNEKTVLNCETRVAKLNKGALKKTYRNYSDVCKKYAKNSVLIKAAAATPCLQEFYDALKVANGTVVSKAGK